MTPLPARIPMSHAPAGRRPRAAPAPMPLDAENGVPLLADGRPFRHTPAVNAAFRALGVAVGPVRTSPLGIAYQEYRFPAGWTRPARRRAARLIDALPPE